MARVYFSKVLNVPPQDAWAIVRDFGGIASWFPFVEQSLLRDGGPQQVGTIRVNTIFDKTQIEERLLEISDRDRRIVYDIIKADIPTKNYSATLEIHAVTADPQSCFAEWSADFDVDGDPASAIEWVRDGIFRVCLEELERVIRAA